MYIILRTKIDSLALMVVLNSLEDVDYDTHAQNYRPTYIERAMPSRRHVYFTKVATYIFRLREILGQIEKKDVFT